MGSPDTTESSLSRRALLGRTAAGVAGVAATTTPVGAASQTVTQTVMTQNMYLGFGLTELLRAESMSAVRRVTGEFLSELDPALYEARADSFAATVETADPAIVALQEAVTIQRQKPGDFGTFPSEPASELVVDFLDDIRTALADRGLDYTVAAETVTNEFELPADTDDGQVDVRVTDRDVLLVRDDVDTGAATTATYDATLQLPVPGTDLELTVERGYCMVETTVDGADLTAVSTHLESSSSEVRREQAGELLDALPTDEPCVVGGDFNSAPGEAAYDLLTGSLTDPYTRLRPDADGYTCCQADDLRNDQSQLDRRIDGLLYRGAVEPTAVGRVGHRSSDRTTVEIGGETVSVWPSDHAGVVGTFELDASATPATATPSAGSPQPTGATPSNATATGGSGPGFGALSAALAVVLGAWLRRRRG